MHLHHSSLTSSPQAMTCIFLCLLLISLPISWGQSLDRLARSNDRTNEDYNGTELLIYEVGSGIGTKSPRPLICYTNDTRNVNWFFPNESQVPSIASDETPLPANNSDIFSWNGSSYGVSLHRGPDFVTTGEYCCVRNGTIQRLCVNLITWPNLERIARSSDPSNTNFSGSTLSIKDVGSGASGLPRPLLCYTQDTAAVYWVDPQGKDVKKKSYPDPASNSSIISWDGSGHGLSLFRGPDYLKTGEYCCERRGTNQRLCVRLITLCGSPPNVSSASFEKPLKSIVGTSVHYTCNSGLSLVGSHTVTCLESGLWSTPPSCTAVIVIHGITAIKTNNTEIVFTDIGNDRSRPSLKCHTDLSTCCGANEMGQWTYPDGSLVLGYEHNQPFYAVRKAQGISLRRKHRFNRGFSLSPTGSYCCTVPSSQGEKTLCVSIVVCPSLPPLINGMINYSDTTLGEGTVATYSCNQPFPLIGDDTRICRSDNRWHGPPPHCYVFCVDITDEQSFQNHSITYNIGYTNDRPVGTVATYTPLSPTDNEILRRCLNDGTWSGSPPSSCQSA